MFRLPWLHHLIRRGGAICRATEGHTPVLGVALADLLHMTETQGFINGLLMGLAFSPEFTASEFWDKYVLGEKFEALEDEEDEEDEPDDGQCS